MENMINFVEKYLNKYKILVYLILIIYSAFRVIYYYKINAGSGDEGLFISDLSFLNENGVFLAIKKQVAITYLILASPFSLFFKEYIALRMVNFLLLITLIIYIKNRISNLIYFVPFIFYIFNAKSFFIGTNDALFQTSLIIFFIETYNIINKRKYSFSLAFTSLCVVIFTREMFIVYFPVILFSIYFWWREEVLNFRKIIIPIFTFLILLALNIPSFIVNGKPSYDDKSQCVSKNGWSRYQYLSQIKANEGVIEEGQHIGWGNLDKYIEEHGKESLPSSIFESIIFDPLLTIKEFFKDLFFSLIYSVRQQGIILLFVFYCLLLNLFNLRKEISKLYIPIVVVSMHLIFSFIIISNVESRWLVPVNLLAVFYFYELFKIAAINKIILGVNSVVILIFMFYGISKQFLFFLHS